MFQRLASADQESLDEFVVLVVSLRKTEKQIFSRHLVQTHKYA